MAKEKLIMDYTNGDTVPHNDFDYYYCKIWYLPEKNKFKMVDLSEVSTPLDGWCIDEVSHYYTPEELTDILWYQTSLAFTFIECADRSDPTTEAVCTKLEKWFKNNPHYAGCLKF